MKFIKIPNKDFEIKETLVTQSLWEKWMGNNPSIFKGPDDLPAENVSWNDVQEFIKKLNEDQKEFTYRLPTEQEWEYCCGKEINEKDLEKHAWYYKNSKNKTHPVKQKLPNEFGLYDMLGNLWEWCEDWYDNDKDTKNIRGGSWYNAAQFLRSAFRSNGFPNDRYKSVGFRLVRTVYSPLSFNTLKLDSEKLALAVAKVQASLDELKELLK